MSDKSREFMEIALDIAFSRLGKTSPNPSVGAVIVRNGEIISKGGTSHYGSDHAEVVAINNALSDLNGSEIYISLEPCCHYSKTPPCTNAIISSHISRVYIPILDPNPAVTGKGVKILKEAGVDVVIMSELADKAYDLIRQFKKYILLKKPYVIHKTAITLDGRIATESGDSKWISNEYSRFITHKLRSIVDAVIIGKNTLIKDNPKLNVRLNSFSDDIINYFKSSDIAICGKDSFFVNMLLKSPVSSETAFPHRIVIGLPEKIDLSNNIFFNDNYIFFVDKKQRDKLIRKCPKIDYEKMIDEERIIFIRGKTKKEQIQQIMNELYNRGKMLVMLEGGGTIAGSFFDACEIDQFCYFISPKLIGRGFSPVNGQGKKSINDSLILNDVSTVMIKDDVFYNAYKQSTY